MTYYRLYGGRTPFRCSSGRLPVEERGQQSASVKTAGLWRPILKNLGFLGFFIKGLSTKSRKFKVWQIKFKRSCISCYLLNKILRHAGIELMVEFSKHLESD